MRKLLQALFGKPEAPNTAASTIAIDLPFELIMVPGREALAVRQDLLGKPAITPVILGDQDDIQRMVDNFHKAGEPVAAQLKEAARLDIPAWMERRRLEDPGRYAVVPAPWPDTVPQPQGLSLHLNAQTQQPKKSVMVALFPTSNSWELPAHVRYGDWSTCPAAVVHVALHRKWQQDFGSVIACMSSEVIECTVERPPASREAALQLAHEQFLYCPGLVRGGAQTLEALAAGLLGAGTWRFHWD